MKPTQNKLHQAQAMFKCGIRLGGGGLNPAVVEGHTVGLTPTAEDLRDAHYVLERYRELPLPDTSEEHWRFTDLRGFDPDAFPAHPGSLANPDTSSGFATGDAGLLPLQVLP